MEWVFKTDADGAARLFGRAPAPWADGVTPAHAELLGYAPTTDVNGSVLAALGGMDPQAGVAVAGLFLADPFLQMADIARQLSRLGIRTVSNLPTVQLIDGEAGRALERTGHGASSELDVLAAFKAKGFAVLAVACGREMLAACLKLSPDAVIVHPGFAAAAPAARRKSLAGARAMLKSVAAAGVPRRFFYHPHGFADEEIAPVAALAGGIVRLQPCSL
jgi:predicted TIM-barrel enzyme